MREQGSSKGQRWHLVYFVLGAFNVLSVGAGLYLSQSVLGIYRASVDENRHWAQRMARYAELGQLATAANAPGNDVFETGDVAGESARLDEATAALNGALDQAREELHTAPLAERDRLGRHLEQTAAASADMVADARSIFAAKRRGEDAAAGAHMAAMDRNLSATTRALGALRAEVQAIQDSRFEAQITSAGAVGAYQYALLAVVVLMVLGMVAYGLQLARVFAAQQAEVDRRNADLRRVLDNVGQGFVSVDRHGHLSTERSAILAQWFGQSREGDTLWSYLGRAQPTFAACLELAWGALIDDVLPLELAIEQLPSTLSQRGRHYRVDYRPVGDAPIAQVLVVVSDVTDQVVRARAEEEQRETLAVFERILTDRHGFVEFFDEADQLVRDLSAGPRDEARDRRALHTLKGNTALFGLLSFSRRCHELEAVFDDHRTLTSAERRELVEHWERLALRLKALLGERLDQRLELEHPEYSALLSEVVEGAPRWRIAERLRSWTREPAERRLSRVADSARAIARRLDKPDVNVNIAHHQLRLPMEGWAPFWSALTHVLRNAIDHGIEPRDERERSGKAPQGQLSLATYDEGDRLVVEIADDGRGIDWDALRQKAAQRGLDLSPGPELLCVDGLSSKAQATDVSGRGVGMSAVREAARALGGEMEVSSVAGAGTTVRFTFPTHQAAQAWPVVSRPSAQPH